MSRCTEGKFRNVCLLVLLLVAGVLAVLAATLAGVTL